MYNLCVAKTKALISFAVTAPLICVFVFEYAKTRFSLDAAENRTYDTKGEKLAKLLF